MPWFLIRIKTFLPRIQIEGLIIASTTKKWIRKDHTPKVQRKTGQLKTLFIPHRVFLGTLSQITFIIIHPPTLSFLITSLKPHQIPMLWAVRGGKVA